MKDGGRCPESVMPVDDFEKEVDSILEQFEIPEKFKTWAIKWLNAIHKKDSKAHAKQLKIVNKKHSESDQRLRNLILMRANDEIDVDELRIMKAAVKKIRKNM